MKPYFIKALMVVLLVALTLPACAPQVTEIPVALETATTSAPSATLTTTPAPRALKICLGEEPNTLYPYGNLNSTARSVLSAIYDGPMDVKEYGYEPIILEKIPTLEDRDAQISPIKVSAGDQVIDSSGNVVSLAAG